MGGGAGVQAATPATTPTSAAPLQPGTGTYVPEPESSCRNSTEPPGVTPVLDASVTVASMVTGTPMAAPPAADGKLIAVLVAAAVIVRITLRPVGAFAELLPVVSASPL